MTQEENILRCNFNTSGDRCGNLVDVGGGGMDDSGGSRSKKTKQKKVPQTGLGVAQLEQIRLEEQQKKGATVQAANILANNAISSHNDSTTCSGFDLSFSLFVILGNASTMVQKELGPKINFREYSFFENPLLPQQVKESWLDVHLCQEGSQSCQVSNSTSQTGVLKFPRRSTEETLGFQIIKSERQKTFGVWTS
ncbi:unnamed protein product [Fraxinus pennsylvanica]|uniref:Uncharacterized protein n=1 Tax=Fraxinus pennsylvanica TaxID=56036 RepID=A0AAD1ZLF1_9LAMI|nr:unnamed protein product [Fraxinus pennsylvanica]